MARLLLLGVASILLVGGTGFLSLPVLLLSPLQGATTDAPAQANAKPVPPTPPTDDRYLAKYGGILKVNDRPPYLYRLTMPFPGFGELKVPTSEELDMRVKLEQLAALPDAEIRAQLEKWPGYNKMSLTDEGAMLTRIQMIRDYRTKRAQQKAEQLGLFTLTAAQQAQFEKEYWDKQLAMNRQLSKQLTPIIQAAEQKMNEDLFREFSSPGSLAQGVKPAKPPAALPSIKTAPPADGAK